MKALASPAQIAMITRNPYAMMSYTAERCSTAEHTDCDTATAVRLHLDSSVILLFKQQHSLIHSIHVDLQESEFLIYLQKWVAESEPTSFRFLISYTQGKL